MKPLEAEESGDDEAGRRPDMRVGQKPQQSAATIAAGGAVALPAPSTQASRLQPRISGRKRVLYMAQIYEKASVQITTAAARGGASAARHAVRQPATASAAMMARIS